MKSKKFIIAAVALAAIIGYLFFTNFFSTEIYVYEPSGVKSKTCYFSFAYKEKEGFVKVNVERGKRYVFNDTDKEVVVYRKYDDKLKQSNEEYVKNCVFAVSAGKFEKVPETFGEITTDTRSSNQWIIGCLEDNVISHDLSPFCALAYVVYDSGMHDKINVISHYNDVPVECGKNYIFNNGGEEIVYFPVLFFNQYRSDYTRTVLDNMRKEAFVTHIAPGKYITVDDDKLPGYFFEGPPKNQSVSINTGYRYCYDIYESIWIVDYAKSNNAVEGEKQIQILLREIEKVYKYLPK